MNWREENIFSPGKDNLSNTERVARKRKNRSSKLLIVALALFVFPLLVISAFYAGSNLKVSPLSYHFGGGGGQGFQNLTGTQPRGENKILPPFMNLSFPFPMVDLAEVLLVVTVVVVLALLLRVRASNTKRVRPFEEADFQEERLALASILDNAVAKLNSGSGYRETVLQCYKLISQALENKSTLDGRTLTAREFKSKVSEILGIDSPYLSKVTDLFELARYSKDEITREEALAASDCLSNLAAFLKMLARPAGVAQGTAG